MLARNRAGLTQQALGAPDLSKSFISLLESGRSYPSLETVIALARRMRTSVGSLLFDPADLRLETALNLLHMAAALDPVVGGADALRLAGAAEQVLAPLPPALQAQAWLVRARVLVAQGQFDEAVRVIDDVAALAARHRLDGIHGRALALKGLTAAQRGDVKAAIPALEQAVEMMRRGKTARTEEHVRALIALGGAYVGTGQLERSRRAYRRAMDLATRMRARRLRGRALWGLGVVAWSWRHPDQAAAWLEQAVEALQAADGSGDLGAALTALGILRYHQGRYGDALAVLQRALGVREQHGDAPGRSDTLDRIAQVLLAMDRRGDAARMARRALREAQAAGARGAEAQAQLTLARVLRAQGRRQEAVDLMRAALAAFKRAGLDQGAAAASAHLVLWARGPAAPGETKTAEAVPAQIAPDPLLSPPAGI
ncbi:MAG: tetratricopeptide repeat protein [Armatimonadota bacterium]|nr:tetratricopeptide repeat protein [Armatimonadota bacterium]